MTWIGWLGLWHINHCRLFKVKSSLYIHTKYIWFGLVGFYGISTTEVYLMTNPLYTYIIIIIIIMSLCQHRYFWPSLAIPPYCPLLPAGLQGYIPYRYVGSSWTSCLCRPCEGVHMSTSLMSSSLLLQQCPACLVRLILIVFVIGGRGPYSRMLLLYGCTAWMLTKRLEKKLDGHYTRMLRAILNNYKYILSIYDLVWLSFMAYQLLKVI